MCVRYRMCVGDHTSRFDFFPASRSHKMMPSEGLVFWFFLNELCPIRDPHEMTAPKNSRSRPGSVESYLNGQYSKKKWRVVDPKKCFFPKNQELAIYTATVQTHPGSNGIGRSLRKIQKGAATKQELICVSRVFYYLCGVLCPAFNFAFLYLPNKKLILVFQKCKRHFSRDKTKIGLRGIPLHPKASCIYDMAWFRQTMPWSGPNLAHLT
jgi:hypothetical protein